MVNIFDDEWFELANSRLKNIRVDHNLEAEFQIKDGSESIFKYRVVVNNNQIQIVKGGSINFVPIFALDFDTARQISRGESGPSEAITAGKVKILGNIDQLVKSASIFEKVMLEVLKNESISQDETIGESSNLREVADTKENEDIQDKPLQKNEENKEENKNELHLAEANYKDNLRPLDHQELDERVINTVKVDQATEENATNVSKERFSMEVLSSRVLLRPTNLERSIKFYRDDLGLGVAREFGQGKDRGVVFYLGGGFLEVSGVGSGAGPNLSVWLQVRDIYEVETELKKRNVLITRGPRKEPWGLMEMWVSDPDGVRLYIVEIPDDHPLRKRDETFN